MSKISKNNGLMRILRAKSFLAMARAAEGSPIFRNLFAKANGRQTDILRNGDLSCAFFVSCLLRIHGFIGGVHATVSSTVRDMKTSGWTEIRRPRAGAVVLWSPQKSTSGETHAHLGICLSTRETITNYDKARSPQIKPIRYRPVESFWWHPGLDE